MFCVCTSVAGWHLMNGLFKHVYLHVQLSGGPVDGLVEALQSLGVSEGVRLLRDSQPREDKQNTGTSSYSERENLSPLTPTQNL